MNYCEQRSMFISNLEDVDHPYECYRSTTDFINRIVDRVVLNVMQIIDNMGTLAYDVRYDIMTRKLGCFANAWPTCGSLNVQNGLESIIQEMKTWNALAPLKEWMFHVSFVGLQYKSNTEFYTYEVLWSVPTPAYPEPQVTVSVYFYIAVNHTYPPNFPIDVTYVFEAHQFVNTLDVIFRPKWLYDIFDMKTMMFRSFNF